MGNQLKRTSDKEQAQNRHPEVSDHGDLRGTEANAAFALSPAAIMKLQRTIGNQAVLRLLSGNESGKGNGKPVQQTDSTVPLIQRETLSDIRVESEDFWTHVMTRVMVRYGQWINDTRQALNQFVTDLNDQKASVDWSAVLQSWIGVAGTYGDVANALWATAKAIVASVPEGSELSLAELTDIENAVLQKLSDKTANVESDLPIYKLLREKKLNEPSEKRTNYRMDISSELEKALNALPRPELLRQKLVLRWIRGDSAKSTGYIVYQTRYRLDSLDKVDDSTVKETETADHLGARIKGVAKPEGTITALKGAYGRNAELHKLPVKFYLLIYAAGTTRFNARGEGIAVDYVKEDGIWKPSTGLGTEFSYDLFSYWLKNGKKLTLADLKVSER